MTQQLVAGIDSHAHPSLRLGPHFDFKTMLPTDDRGATTPVAPRYVAAFDAEWRQRAYDAINGTRGRDAAMWDTEMARRASGYPAAVRVAAAPLGEALRGVVCDPNVAGGGVRAQEVPTKCGTSSTAAHIALLTGSVAFGRGCMAPYLRLGAITRATRARLELRASIQSSWRCPSLRVRVSARVEAVNAEEAVNAVEAALVEEAADAEEVPAMGGGCMWGTHTCASCGDGSTLDAWHRICECTELAGERADALSQALRLVAQWGAHSPLRKKETEAAEQALQQIASPALTNTRPYRVFMFLAALAAPVVDAACAGLPMAWANLLHIPSGAVSRQEASLGVKVFEAFAPLAISAAKAVSVAPLAVPQG